MVYLHTASLAHMSSERSCSIYEYRFSQAYPELAKEIGVCRNELDDAETREAAKLRSWIYGQQMKMMREERAES